MITSEPDRYEKLRALSTMAGDDVLGRPGPVSQFRRDLTPSNDGRTYRAPYSRPDKNPMPGIYKASMPGGKTISLMRTMFTDFCMMDCLELHGRQRGIFHPIKNRRWKRKWILVKS